MSENKNPIYKLLRSQEWEQFQNDSIFEGAAVDLEDGFIHFSTAAQVAETARRYFSMFDDVWLVAIDSESLECELKWEPSRGGDLFPHLYGTLNISNVVSSQILEKNSDGEFVFSFDN